MSILPFKRVFFGTYGLPAGTPARPGTSSPYWIPQTSRFSYFHKIGDTETELAKIFSSDVEEFGRTTIEPCTLAVLEGIGWIENFNKKIIKFNNPQFSAGDLNDQVVKIEMVLKFKPRQWNNNPDITSRLEFSIINNNDDLAWHGDTNEFAPCNPRFYPFPGQFHIHNPRHGCVFTDTIYENTAYADNNQTVETDELKEYRIDLTGKDGTLLGSLEGNLWITHMNLYYNMDFVTNFPEYEPNRPVPLSTIIDIYGIWIEITYRGGYNPSALMCCN